VNIAENGDAHDSERSPVRKVGGEPSHARTPVADNACSGAWRPCSETIKRTPR
jgi:hypothetical protein